MRMKKGIVVGIVAGVLLAQGSSIFAESIKKNIGVTYGVVKRILVDGIDKTPSSDKMPFVFEGSTYVPLRYIGETLGKKVDYDSATGTVIIGKNVKGNYLTDSIPYMTDEIHAFKINNSNDEGMSKSGAYYYEKNFVMKSGGKQYSKGITVTPDSDGIGKLFYNLDGQYSKLEGFVAFDENYRLDDIDKGYEVKFYVDDKLSQEITIKKGELPKLVSVNLDKGLQLKIEFVRPAGDTSENPNISLLEMKLT
ncbi:stalk domain-containing protein [Paenibacillus sp. GCM10027627]|uniref:stalk domain-containing protein n=1 Tax=unclassified Paenibacillus TaxID=185978 RepID=UPI0036268EC0